MAKLSDVAVFADCGVTAHQMQYRQAGATIARHGAHLFCLARDGQWPRALVESVLAGGGRVTVASGPSKARLAVPHGVTVITETSEQAAAVHIVRTGQVVIGMPGSIDTVGALYAAWTAAGGALSKRPIGLLNHNRAYDVVKGFASDVAAVGRSNIDAMLQVSDNFDDLWNRLTRLV